MFIYFKLLGAYCKQYHDPSREKEGSPELHVAGTGVCVLGEMRKAAVDGSVGRIGTGRAKGFIHADDV